jgi:uncharacterized protein (TIGR00730 family)
MANPTRFDSVCVFCGSRSGVGDVYRQCAVAFGALLAQRGLTLVYGGAHLGLMGALADAALAAGGKVIGVMPQSMIDREIGHTGLTKLHIVGTMHERKALMAELAGAFVALPGAFGTLDEFCEILTWAQIGIHGKPCGILNISGYYDSLLAMFSHAVREGFLNPAHRDMIAVSESGDCLLDLMESGAATPVSKWATPVSRATVP